MRDTSSKANNDVYASLEVVSYSHDRNYEQTVKLEVRLKLKEKGYMCDVGVGRMIHTAMP